jgi:hypothetical protein
VRRAPARDLVPVERVEVADVEDQPVAIRDGALEQRVRLDQIEERVGVCAGAVQCVQAVVAHGAF